MTSAYILEDPLSMAIRYANDPVHEGCAYSLIIMFEGGGTLEVRPGTHGQFLTGEYDEPTFIDRSKIAAVTVSW